MLGFLRQRERFIPVQTPTIVERILADPPLTSLEKEQLRALVDMLQARFHFEFLAEAEELKKLYDPFNPDRDTLPLWFCPEAEREGQFERFREEIEFLLDKGNYTKLTPEQLAACMESKSRWGLAVKIDPRQYQEIDVYYRGVRQEQRTECSWRTLWQPTPVQVWVFSRVAVLVRQSHPPRGDVVLLKLFKEIMIDDLKMTWPNVRILMRPVDQIMIAVSALGGLFTPLLKLLVAVTLSPYLVGCVVLGCLMAMGRAVWGFFSCKKNYVKTLTHNLYYQNLANNLSALSQLIEAAEAEEVKEALLAYYLLYRDRDQDYTTPELDRRIEHWLAEQFVLPDVDFEIEDALGKLAAKELVVRRLSSGQTVGSEPGSGLERTSPPIHSESQSESPSLEVAQDRAIWKVYDLPTALRRLDHWWDERFPYHDSSHDEPDRLAESSQAPVPDESPS